MAKRRKTTDATLSPTLTSAGTPTSPAPPGNPMKSRRRRRIWLTIFIMFLSIILFSAIFVYRRSTKPIHVGPRTTFVTGPLRRDGTVNYVAALNLLCSKGVTPENNAAIPLFRVLGANKHTLGPNWRVVLREMKFTPARHPVKTFVPLDTYLKTRSRQSAAPLAQQLAADAAWRFVSAHVWRARQFPVVAKYLRAQTASMAALRQAVKLRRLYIPEVGASMVTTEAFPWFAEIPFAGRALVARAMLDCGRRKYSAARHNLLAAERLGDLSSLGPAWISVAVGTSMTREVSAAEITLAADPRLALPRAFLLNFLARRSRRKLRTISWEINGPERMDMLDDVTQMYRRHRGKARAYGLDIIPFDRPTIVCPALIRWNWVLRSINTNYNRELRAAQLRSPLKQMAALRAFGARLARYKNTLLTNLFPSVAFRNCMCYTLMVSNDDIVNFDIAARQLNVLARASIALALIKIDTGHFPRTLGALTPKYLRHMPKDVYTGQPLHYRPTRNGYLLTCNWKAIPLPMGKTLMAQLTVNYPAKPAKIPHEPNIPMHVAFPPPTPGAR